MNFTHYLEKLSQGAEYKLILSMLFSIITFIEGFYGSMIWVLSAFIILDFISGIWKSIINGQRIISSKLRSSVTKVASYIILITALIIAGNLDPVFIPLVTVAYYYCIFTEFKSILENLEAMGLKVPSEIFDRVTSMIGKTSKDNSDNDKK